MMRASLGEAQERLPELLAAEKRGEKVVIECEGGDTVTLVYTADEKSLEASGSENPR